MKATERHTKVRAGTETYKTIYNPYSHEGGGVKVKIEVWEEQVKTLKRELRCSHAQAEFKLYCQLEEKYWG